MNNTEKIAATLIVVLFTLGLFVSVDSEKRVQKQIEESMPPQSPSL